MSVEINHSEGRINHTEGDEISANEDGGKGFMLAVALSCALQVDMRIEVACSLTDRGVWIFAKIKAMNRPSAMTITQARALVDLIRVQIARETDKDMVEVFTATADALSKAVEHAEKKRLLN